MDHSQKKPMHEQSGNLNSSYQLYSQFAASENPFLGTGILRQPFPAMPLPFSAAPCADSQGMDWDPRVMLDNLAFLAEKIRQIQDVIRPMIGTEGRFSQQQQLVSADLTCLIIQLISTAGSLLPSMKNSVFLSNPPVGQSGAGLNGSSSSSAPDTVASFEQDKDMNFEYEDLFRELNDSVIAEGADPNLVDDQDVKDGEDGGTDGENLPSGSYEVLQLEKEEILAPHTHFCTICGKGFKRDANLRMHMRGHGDKYKSPAALAKPPKDTSSEPVLVKRYSCPFVGCKRNKEHKSFQPLKTILCMKNHYKRSHCEKSYTCSRCGAKKFSVIADLKTHEKHCGREKWLCSCGTSFSRKDKLFGHVALFQGHTPALPPEEPKVSDLTDQRGSNEGAAKSESTVNTFMWKSSSGNGSALEMKGLAGNSDNFLSPMSFGSFSFGGLDEFPMSSFALLPPASFGNAQKNSEN